MPKSLILFGAFPSFGVIFMSNYILATQPLWNAKVTGVLLRVALGFGIIQLKEIRHEFKNY